MIDSFKELKKMLGVKLKKYRNLANISQEKFAEMCDCSAQTISGAETGYSNPSLKLLYKISENLNVPLSHLFNFYPQKLSQNPDDLIILNAYNKLDEEKKRFVLNMINHLIEGKS